MWRDLERVCAGLNLPLRRASVFPRSGLAAARVVCVGGDEPWLPDFIRAVYHANFAEDRDIAEPAVVQQFLTTLGLPADGLMVRASSAEAKVRLRAQCEEAAARGIFGAPTLFASEEMFWGNDRLEDALDWCVAHPA